MFYLFVDTNSDNITLVASFIAAVEVVCCVVETGGGFPKQEDPKHTAAPVLHSGQYLVGTPLGPMA